MDKLVAKSDAFFRDQKQLNPEALQSLVDYTTFGSFHINKVLRENKGDLQNVPEDRKEKKQIIDIDSLFHSADATSKPLTLYRGVKFEEFTKEDYGYLSTSYDMYVSTSKYINPRSNCCLMVINVPVGTKCLFIENVSAYPDEKEVLLPRNGKFVLTAVSKSESSVDTFFVTYLQDTTISENTLSAVVIKAEQKMEYLEKVIETTKDANLTPKELHYFTNNLLSYYDPASMPFYRS